MNQLATVDTVKTKMQLALTKQSLSMQAITDKIDSIEPNEDNLQAMADAIKMLKQIDDIIDEQHTIEKKPFLEGGRIVDAAKKDMLSLTASLRAKIQPKYVQLCQAAVKRKQDQELEKTRVKTIKDGIEHNILDFSTRIAACKKLDELLSVERLINLEKGRKDKYQEFAGEFADRANTVLLPLLKSQKEVVRELEAISNQMAQAEDDEAIIAHTERKEALEAQLEHNQVSVQEMAVNQAISSHTTQTVQAEEILPDIRAKRRTWEWEIMDIAMLQKKMPQLVKLVPDEDAIKAYLNNRKADKTIREETVNGIRIYQKVSY